MDKVPGILLVDRSAHALNETVLGRREGFITTAARGADGLDLAVEKQPRLVIFGYHLEDMTGPEFCRLIRQDVRTKMTSLLYLGERTSRERADLCIAAGCNDAIFLPLQGRELEDKIEKLTAIPIRRELRTLVKMRVNLDAAGRSLLGHSVNISSGGMLVQVNEILPPEAGLLLHFYLSGDPTPLRLNCQVVRAEFTGGLPRYGVKYLNLQDEQRRRLEGYVQRLRSRELH